MSQTNSVSKSSSHLQALSLLEAEHQSLVHWLHDDLGQNLIAIKSFANAIIEQNENASDDTAELADIIRQAANAAYRATYDLMQEIRARDGADKSPEFAIVDCLENARLKEKGIEYRLEMGDGLEALDNFTLAEILRSLRTFVNYSKLCEYTPSLTIELQLVNSDNCAQIIELRLAHQGEFEIQPGDSPGLIALQKRIESINGLLTLQTNNHDQYSLNIQLKPALADSEPL